jgi:hypothetical protein
MILGLTFSVKLVLKIVNPRMIVHLKVIDIPICHGYQGNDEVDDTIKSVFSETPNWFPGFENLW